MIKSALAFLKYFRDHKSEINFDHDELSAYLDDFLGIDNDSNSYWSAVDKQIFIFGNNGNFTQAIQIDTEFADDLIMRRF
ncbi:MAG: hypothetical protein JEZ04_16835 [Spirochaetales bacterium]|nr:hypothetical protein [Spirochaetales bacterium]